MDVLTFSWIRHRLITVAASAKARLSLSGDGRDRAALVGRPNWWMEESA